MKGETEQTWSEPSWEALRAHLLDEVARLEELENVVLTEPVTYGPPTGLLRKKPRPLPGRFVQFLRVDPWMSAEVVGATVFGGDWETTPEQDAAIRALGWYAPGEQPDTAASTTNYRNDLPLAEVPALVANAVAALEVLGLTPQGPWTFLRHTRRD
ncbi:hypothetical protein EV189_2357 [Motilibacter rhizosphaerae]|uniref:TY-Chap N-terminal domain-containing protein n=1 Tax=Motilibacter rhizosphaerae TaxID=598652 RepID=A0A4Q7NNX1_9ACTN|nr:hypothetical protein [Motilibacter rhizosphaerae]RZS86939.1 hypothetical protein EV189_2357 [Motilibacter rhizosphaerae]